MKIGYFQHWFQAAFTLPEFLKKQGYDVEKIDYSQSGYLEKYDVVLIEQNGFNDFIENDQDYFWEYVERGGVALFMHQDHCRWAPDFLPDAAGFSPLVLRHLPTIPAQLHKSDPPFKTYMIPGIEPAGEALFHYPNKIAPEEMLNWEIDVNSFSVLGMNPAPTRVRTAALSCYFPAAPMQVLGSYADPATRDAALLMQYRHGRGLAFFHQLLFPETERSENARCLKFYVRYFENLFAYFERVKAGKPEPPVPAAGTLPAGKGSYALTIHMHSLDWYGADASIPGLKALMRNENVDFCALALKYADPADERLKLEKYQDEKVMFLDGQEYHPFNWNGRPTHNEYHLLALGIDHDSYTNSFTRSLYTDGEVSDYLHRAIDYIHNHGGVAVATHPWEHKGIAPYWPDYPVDAVDHEFMTTLAGTDIERAYLAGKRFAVLDSVDCFGIRMYYENPAVNFIMLADGAAPCRDAVVEAIRAGRTIAGCHFGSVEARIDGNPPGSELANDRSQLKLTLKAAVRPSGGELKELRIYADDKVIKTIPLSGSSTELEVRFDGSAARRFVRVEISGGHKYAVANTTPWFV